MSPDFWKAVLGLVSLAALWTAWFFKKQDDTKKVLDDEDKKIDSANNADDIMRESGRLRK